MAGRFGLIGRTLGHSYSPAIYKRLAGLDYDLVELEPNEVERFCRTGGYDGFNVTIPYKRVVADVVDELSSVAQRLGSVNTVVRRPDGTLYGDNTDYTGFSLLLDTLEVPIEGLSALVLGATGGAGITCMAVLEDRGAHPIAVSRAGQVNYDNLDAYRDVDLIVNATPVGMAPHCPASPVDITMFPQLKGVVDIIYNPARTGLALQAERLGIPAVTGLTMLVGQAAAAAELYTRTTYSLENIRSVTSSLARSEHNIALIGMPGAGKTRVGQELAQLLGAKHLDADWELEHELGCACSSFITEHGEAAFRARETEVLKRLGALSRTIISCGGGVVTRDENYGLLHQNSLIVMLDRPLEELSSAGRPLSARHGVEQLAAERMERYRAWADVIVPSQSSAVLTARLIFDTLREA